MVTCFKQLVKNQALRRARAKGRAAAQAAANAGVTVLSYGPRQSESLRQDDIKPAGVPSHWHNRIIPCQ